jgi:hypothetical protein
VGVVRVPFALVGVLLLVGSATFAGSLQVPAATQPAVDDALDETAAETQSALRSAVTDAAQAAARNPVVTPADTRFGRVLNDSNTFRESLRVRVYLTVRDRLRRLTDTTDGVRVSVRLPATSTPGALRTAKRRVSVARAPEDAGVRATVENVTLVAERNGREVGRRTISPTVTVPVPTLFVHDRVTGFEQRLNAGPAASGLGGKLTARLYALAWTRGYAQWGGAPIGNVVANRHLAVLTNGAIREMQREHFGHSDPRTESMLGVALAHTGFTDIVGGTDNPVTAALADGMTNANFDQAPTMALEEAQSRQTGATAAETTTIGVNRTADVVFLQLLPELDRLARQTYTADVERRTTVSREWVRVLNGSRPPRLNWSLAATNRTTETTVERRDPPEATADGRWHPLAAHSQFVEATTTVVRTWNTPNGTATTTERRRTRYAVDITLAGRHDNGTAPVRPFATVHEPGGPLGGPNLADVRSRAVEHLLADPGGVDEVAQTAATDGGGTLSTTVVGDRPQELSDWLYADLASLRQRVRNVSVSVTKGELATMQANPARRLAARLDDRRTDLLDAPDTYDGVADRARIAVRRAYLDAVGRALEARASNTAERQSAFQEAVRESDDISLADLQTEYRHREPDAFESAVGAVQMRVQTSPSYLTRGALSGDDIAGIPEGTTEHPLAVRNFNAITVPYGDVADAVASALFGPDRVRLRTAAQTLRIDRTRLGNGVDTTALRSNVWESMVFLFERVDETLAQRGYGTAVSRSRVLNAGMSRWDSLPAEAIALTNGSAARAISHAAARRWNLSARQRDRLGLELQVIIDESLTLEEARPPQPAVSDVSETVRGMARTMTTRLVENATSEIALRGLNARTGRSLSRLPAGLPITPLPGAWFATANYWEVQVRGEYARFAVSVPRGSPVTPGGHFRYVRDGQPVEFDVDSDGAPERLGRGTRVSFRTHSSVAVAVPSGVRGVGDVDGQMDERSPGWPDPGR